MRDKSYLWIEKRREKNTAEGESRRGECWGASEWEYYIAVKIDVKVVSLDISRQSPRLNWSNEWWWELIDIRDRWASWDAVKPSPFLDGRWQPKWPASGNTFSQAKWKGMWSSISDFIPNQLFGNISFLYHLLTNKWDSKFSIETKN